MKKYKKNHTKMINLKHQLRHGMKSLNYVLDHILFLKRHGTVTDNPSIMIHINKIVYRFTFKTKTGYYNALNNEITWKH